MPPVLPIRPPGDGLDIAYAIIAIGSTALLAVALFGVLSS
jgi:hypothetical protein